MSDTPTITPDNTPKTFALVDAYWNCALNSESANIENDRKHLIAITTQCAEFERELNQWKACADRLAGELSRVGDFFSNEEDFRSIESVSEEYLKLKSKDGGK